MRSVIIEEKGRTGPAAGSKKKTSSIKTHSDVGRFQLSYLFYKNLTSMTKEKQLADKGETCVFF